jgi:hypothetical protein
MLRSGRRDRPVIEQGESSLPTIDRARRSGAAILAVALIFQTFGAAPVAGAVDPTSTQGMASRPADGATGAAPTKHRAPSSQLDSSPPAGQSTVTTEPGPTPAADPGGSGPPVQGTDVTEPDPSGDQPSRTGIRPAPELSGPLAPDGVPLGPQRDIQAGRPTDLPPIGDPSLAPATAPAGTCTTTRSVASGDGVRLAIGTNGSVTGVNIGSRCVDRLVNGGGFAVRHVGGQANLLHNGTFESVSGSTPTSWFRAGTGPAISTTAHHDGVRSVVITRTSTGTSGDLHQTVSISPYTNYMVGGFLKAYSVTPTSFSATAPIVSRDVSPVRISAAVKDSGGHLLATYYANGYTNTADWHYESVGFFADALARSVTVSVSIINGRGSGWFDGISLAPILAAGSSAVSTSSVVQVDSDTLTQTGTVPSEDLNFNATYHGNANHIRIDGKVTLKTGVSGDRAVQVYFNLPINAVGWYWADYARSSRKVLASTTYKFYSHQTLPTSRYPFSTLYDGTSALSIGSPLQTPRGYTMMYDSRQGWTIVFDLGVSSSATKLSKAATFSIVIFTSDKNWGFRGATSKFYAIEPTSFTRFPNHFMDGIPFINPKLNELDDPSTQRDESKDFGLGMDIVGITSQASWGINNTKWADARNIAANVYVHMWGAFSQKCSQPNVTICNAKTYDDFIAKLTADSNQTSDMRRREESYAALHNATKDINGRVRYDAPVGAYRVFANSDPDFATSASRPNWVDTVQKWDLDLAANAAAAQNAHIDGFYVDSTSGFRQWGAIDDYDKSHWAVAGGAPLMFSYDSGKVIERNYFNNYAIVEKLRGVLHAKDQFLALDFNGDEVTAGGWLGTDLTDYFLIENGLPDRAYPQWGVSTDSYALLKRSMADQRALGSVDQHGCAPGFPITEMRYRVQQSLFYDIFPGPCRWERTSWWFPTMRALYKMYTPWFRKFADAGWEVLTNARSSNSNLWLERYGNLKDNDLYLALRNETGSTQAATLAITLKNNYDNGTVPAAVQLNLHYQVHLANGTYGMKSVTWSSCNGGVALNVGHTAATVSLTTSNFGALPPLTTGIMKVKRLGSC